MPFMNITRYRVVSFGRTATGSGYKEVLGRALLLLTAMGVPLVLAAEVTFAADISCTPGVTCIGTDGDDKMTGTVQDDTIQGRSGDDDIRGLEELDTLEGGPGKDRLNGGPGNDMLRGGRGADRLRGGESDDRYLFADDWGTDTINDDSAVFGNSLSFTELTTPLKLDLVASPSAHEARSGNNTLNFPATFVVTEADGGGADDTILGNNGDNFLNGNQGNDVVDGRGGVDTLVGGDGDDKMTGGSGQDTIQAEGGNDTIFAVDGEADTIECGDGTDKAHFDVGLDTHIDCEVLNP